MVIYKRVIFFKFLENFFVYIICFSRSFIKLSWTKQLQHKILKPLNIITGTFKLNIQMNRYGLETHSILVSMKLLIILAFFLEKLKSQTVSLSLQISPSPATIGSTNALYNFTFMNNSFRYVSLRKKLNFKMKNKKREKKNNLLR